MAEEETSRIIDKNLKKYYLDGRVKALRGVSCEINRGEFVIVYGPSGCGKSTFLGLLAALDKPTEGTVLVGGDDIYKLGSKGSSFYRRHQVGMVFQQFNLVSTVSARDNIVLPMILAGVKNKIAEQRAMHLLSILGLNDRAHHKPSQMSGGEQQRVAVGRALALNPNILLVDEPTGNLDEENSRDVIQTLQKINAWGRTVIMVTHNPDYLKLADRVLEMRNGCIVSEKRGSVKAVEDSDGLAEIKNFTPDKIEGAISRRSMNWLAWSHLTHNRLRTFFASLGVALGVGAIVGLVSIGMGLQRIASGQIASLSSLMTVEAVKSKDSTVPFSDDTVDKMKQIKNVTMVSPTIVLSGNLSTNNMSTAVIATGVKEESLDFEGIQITNGDFSGIVISEAAAKNFGVSEGRALIGKSATLSLMGDVGENASLSEIIASVSGKQLTAEITGVTNDTIISAAYASLDKVQTASKVSEYTSIRLKADNRKHVAEIRKAVEGFGYTTNSVTDLVERLDKVFFIIEAVLGAIGGIALLVALLGIVNTMTISLLERTHEVGIMKAIGASNKEIARLFSTESGMLGLLGGVFGAIAATLLGYSLNQLLAALMKASGESTPMVLFYISPLLILTMIVASYVVARVAGWYPSRRAARLSAMEALRYE